MKKLKYLLTGATGVLGSEILFQLLKKNFVHTIYIIIRAKNSTHLQERVNELYHYLNLNSEEIIKIIPINGDVVLPQFGLSNEEFQSLLEVDHIIHCASSVRLDLSEEEAYKNCTEPTQIILNFQNKINLLGRFCKLDFVSTVGVKGKINSPLMEKLVHQKRDFFNTYEKSKAAAEVLVAEALTNGQNITIHRPSMIIGDSKTGRIQHFQIFYFILSFLSGRLTFGVLPRLKTNIKLDLIPVDYVAEVIVHSSQMESFSGRIFNICSGIDFSISPNEIQRLLFIELSKRNIAIKKPKSIPMVLFNFLIQIFLVISKLVILKSMEVKLLNFTKFLKYTESNCEFSNKEASELFKELGLDLSKVNQSLSLSISYFLEHSRRFFN